MAVGTRKKSVRKGTGMKGMTIGGGHKRPTKSGAGLTAKGVAKYRKQNPGSKLKTAVTESKPTGKRAARRKSYCARSAGQMKKFPKAAKNPNSRLRQARKRWKCQMVKGKTHFIKDGTPYYGEVHKMPDQSIHSGKTHTKTSKKVVHFKDLSNAAKNKAGSKMAKAMYKVKSKK